MKNYFAELWGTCILVFLGVWSIEYSNLYYSDNFQASLWLITIVFGMAVTVAILLFGKISGAHINPAVSLAFYLNKELSLLDLIMYVISQLLGAILGAYLINIILPSKLVGTTLPSVNISIGFTCEFVLSYILMLVIFWIADSKNKYHKYAAFVIGFQVALHTYIVGLFTAVSMNPARSLGPALISGHWEYYWLYLLAPTLGMILSFITWKKQKYL
jgi:aquaporin NIP